MADTADIFPVGSHQLRSVRISGLGIDDVSIQPAVVMHYDYVIDSVVAYTVYLLIVVFLLLTLLFPSCHVDF